MSLKSKYNYYLLEVLTHVYKIRHIFPCYQTSLYVFSLLFIFALFKLHHYCLHFRPWTNETLLVFSKASFRFEFSVFFKRLMWDFTKFRGWFVSFFFTTTKRKYLRENIIAFKHLVALMLKQAWPF